MNELVSFENHPPFSIQTLVGKRTPNFVIAGDRWSDPEGIPKKWIRFERLITNRIEFDIEKEKENIQTQINPFPYGSKQQISFCYNEKLELYLPTSVLKEEEFKEEAEFSLNQMKLPINSMQFQYNDIYESTATFVLGLTLKYLQYCLDALIELDKNKSVLLDHAPKELKFVYRRLTGLCRWSLVEFETYLMGYQEFRTKEGCRKSLRNFLLNNNKELGKLFLDLITDLLMQDNCALSTFINITYHQVESIQRLNDPICLNFVRKQFIELRNDLVS